MASLGELEPWLRPYAEWLVRVAEYNGWKVSVNSVYRSTAKQAQLYHRYQRAKAAGDTTVLPAAPPGTSWHEHRRAFDISVTQGRDSPQQAALGRLWESMGGRWGGPRDPVHFQA